MLQRLSDSDTSEEILNANSCSRLKKLKQLNLDITRLYHLPKGVFLHFKYLEKLVLFGNRITGWGNGYEIFGNMTRY
jgi:hypothetical protein